ncbi:hypothetical protein TNCT_427831 [Trichonephila clavata]|uniref:Uncharacterized protein n=1 Tax=Trichonephila clavata TaxID=2740835 RepID=A0A8X6GAB6_TRICU|nr:hypothetical protein TNCT_427831 [Trichonephila clavata]
MHRGARLFQRTKNSELKALRFQEDNKLHIKRCKIRFLPHPGARVARNTENQHPKNPRRTSSMDISPAALLQDPRLTTDYADPCEKHQNMEGLLTKAISYRICFQQLLDYAQENPRFGNPPTYDTYRIT